MGAVEGAGFEVTDDIKTKDGLTKLLKQTNTIIDDYEIDDETKTLKSVKVGRKSLDFDNASFTSFSSNLRAAYEEVRSAKKSALAHDDFVPTIASKKYENRLKKKYSIYTTDSFYGSSISDSIEEISQDIANLLWDCEKILKEINQYDAYKAGYNADIKEEGFETDPEDTLHTIEEEQTNNPDSYDNYPDTGYSHSGVSSGPSYIPAYIPPSVVDVAKPDDKKKTDETKVEDKKKTDEAKPDEKTTQVKLDEKMEDIIKKIQNMDEGFTEAQVIINTPTGKSESIWVDLTSKESINSVLKSIGGYNGKNTAVWGTAISIVAFGGKTGQVYSGNLTYSKDNDFVYTESTYTPNKGNDPPEEQKEEQKEERKEEQKEETKENKTPEVKVTTTSEGVTVQPQPSNTVDYQPPVGVEASTAASSQLPTYTEPVKAATFNFESMDPVITNPDLEASNDPFRIISEEPVVTLDDSGYTPSTNADLNATGANTGTVSSEIKQASITPLEEIDTYKSKTNAAMGAALVGGAALAAGNIGYNVYKAKKDKDEKKDNEG